MDHRDGASAPDAASLLEAAAVVRRVEERLLAAMDVAGIGFFDWDVPSDRVWYLSPFLPQRPRPSDSSETDGASWFLATHPDDIPAARARVDRVIEGRDDRFDTTVRMRLPHYRADGWVHVRSRGTVQGRDAAGRALRIVGVYEDVSVAVAHAAQEREREMALEHATRASALGTLATSLAHELNQPLAALTGFVQASARLLEAGEAHRDEIRQALQRSVALAEKASEIVRRLRRLVQHAPPMQEAIDVAALLSGATEVLARDARTAHVELRRSAVSPDLALTGDRVQLEQVLVNLVRNAIEACAAREDTGRLVQLAAAQVGDRIELRVVDAGAGVPAHAASRLFEPFFTTRASGSGLGLTISRSIVEAHGGAIRLERTGPEGTTFVVSLPTGTEVRDGEG
jgi:signal transduction histidine kinase